MDCSTPGFPVLHHLPELALTLVYWVGDAIKSSHPLLSPSLPPFSLSQHQGLFQLVISSYQVAKVLELQLKRQSLKIIFRIYFFRTDWFYLLVVQRTLKSCLQHHRLKASIFHCSSFFMVQFSHACMTTGKTIARQYIKKQRHHFAYKGPYSQSYGFSNRHVWM